MARRFPIRISSLFALAAFGLLYLPMLAVAAYSVNASPIGLAWGGFTWHWYHTLWSNQLVRQAAQNTLLLATGSALVSTVLGTLLALGIDRIPWGKRVRRLLDAVLYLPVVTPDLIFAAALLVVFGVVQSLTGLLEPGLLTMLIAHITFQIAFVALVVRARMATIGASMEEAARDLYASTPYLLGHVLLPLLWPGILAGFLLAFTLSVDDFVISFFTSGPDSVTLPLYIYSSVKRGISPELHALSTLVFLATIVLVLLVQSVLTVAGRRGKGS